jgi:hypothetical protein
LKRREERRSEEKRREEKRREEKRRDITFYKERDTKITNYDAFHEVLACPSAGK